MRKWSTRFQSTREAALRWWIKCVIRLKDLCRALHKMVDTKLCWQLEGSKLPPSTSCSGICRFLFYCPYAYKETSQAVFQSSMTRIVDAFGNTKKSSCCNHPSSVQLSTTQWKHKRCSQQQVQESPTKTSNPISTPHKQGKVKWCKTESQPPNTTSGLRTSRLCCNSFENEKLWETSNRGNSSRCSCWCQTSVHRERIYRRKPWTAQVLLTLAYNECIDAKSSLEYWEYFLTLRSVSRLSPT